MQETGKHFTKKIVGVNTCAVGNTTYSMNVDCNFPSELAFLSIHLEIGIPNLRSSSPCNCSHIFCIKKATCMKNSAVTFSAQTLATLQGRI